jgi:hypothetical protein
MTEMEIDVLKANLIIWIQDTFIMARKEKLS